MDVVSKGWQSHSPMSSCRTEVQLTPGLHPSRPSNPFRVGSALLNGSNLHTRQAFFRSIRLWASTFLTNYCIPSMSMPSPTLISRLSLHCASRFDLLEGHPRPEKPQVPHAKSFEGIPAQETSCLESRPSSPSPLGGDEVERLRGEGQPTFPFPSGELPTSTRPGQGRSSRSS